MSTRVQIKNFFKLIIFNLLILCLTCLHESVFFTPSRNDYWFNRRYIIRLLRLRDSVVIICNNFSIDYRLEANVFNRVSGARTRRTQDHRRLYEEKKREKRNYTWQSPLLKQIFILNATEDATIGNNIFELTFRERVSKTSPKHA